MCSFAGKINTQVTPLYKSHRPADVHRPIQQCIAFILGVTKHYVGHRRVPGELSVWSQQLVLQLTGLLLTDRLSVHGRRCALS